MYSYRSSGTLFTLIKVVVETFSCAVSKAPFKRIKHAKVFKSFFLGQHCL